MKRALTLLLVVAMLFTLAACSKSNQSSTAETSPQTNVSDSSPQADASAGDSQTASDVPDGVYPSITVASADPEMLSPLLLRRDGKNVVTEIFETLCDVDGWGGEFYGRLAKSWSWEPGEEADVLKVEIYDYIYDSAGNHYTTSDTKFCYETDAEAGYLPEFEKYILGINIIDDYNIEFLCKPGTSDTVRSDYDILGCCLQYTQAAYEASADQMTTTPVGTGPYTLVSFEPGSSVVIQRNANYWQDESLLHRAQEANVEQIKFVFLTENTQKVNALKTGEIDYANNVSLDTLNYFRESEDFNVTAWDKNTVLYLIPNCDTGKPMNDMNLRAALFYACDSADFIAACGGVDCAVRTSAFATPDAMFYNPDWETQDTYYNVCDLELAQEYLSKSGYNGETLQLVYEANGAFGSYYEACALVIGAAMDKLGIKYEISSLETNSLVQMWNYESDAWDLVVSAWGGATGKVQEFWFQAYSTAQFDKNGLGQGNWHDDTLYEMFENLYTVSNSTQETVDEFYNYEVAHFYTYGLCQLKCYDVTISDIESLCFTQRMWFMPGAFHFNTAE